MFNPDEKENRTDRTKLTDPPRKVVGALLEQKERLRYYFMNCNGIAEYYGFKTVIVEGQKKLAIGDLKKIEGWDPETKSILRELYQELK